MTPLLKAVLDKDKIYTDFILGCIVNFWSFKPSKIL